MLQCNHLAIRGIGRVGFTLSRIQIMPPLKRVPPLRPDGDVLELTPRFSATPRVKDRSVR
jgi:hypothetical protein